MNWMQAQEIVKAIVAKATILSTRSNWKVEIGVMIRPKKRFVPFPPQIRQSHPGRCVRDRRVPSMLLSLISSPFEKESDRSLSSIARREC